MSPAPARRRRRGAPALVAAAALLLGLLALLPAGAWSLAPPARPAVRGGPGGPGLTVDGPWPVAAMPGEQQAPALAVGRDGLLVAWETCDDCLDGRDLAVRVLAADGRPIGPMVELATGSADQRGPSVAFNADTGEYLVVWSEHLPGDRERYAVRARRVGADGRLLGDVVPIADVTGVWPRAVASSRGAWHGYDLAWTTPGPRADMTATVIAARHLDAAGTALLEIWQLSPADQESLRPLALPAARSGGTLVVWYAFRLAPAGPAEQPRLWGVRLGASGRPTGSARELVPEPVCAGALADHEGQPDLLMVAVGCRTETPAGTRGPLQAIRLNRSGEQLGPAVPVATDVAATDTALGALGSDHGYLLVRPADEATPGQALVIQALDALGQPDPGAGPRHLGPGESPAAAGLSDGSVVVLASVPGDGADLVAWQVRPGPEATPHPPSPTPGADPEPSPTAARPRRPLALPWLGR